MDSRNITSSKASSLRQQAEALLKEQHKNANFPLTEADKLKLIHELEVHQIELELQNEELVIAKENAERAGEKFTELYDFAPSGYFTLNAEGDIVHLNLAGAQMLGKERMRLVNSRFALFLTNGTRLVFMDFLDEVFNSKSIKSCEVSINNNDQLTTHLQLTGILAMDGKHSLISALDISGRKMAEKAMKESEELQKLNATKDKFFSIIAHDLKSPFNSIMGFSELLVEQITEKNYDGIEKYAGIILQSSQRAMDLLMNLMEWSHTQSGQMTFNPERFDLAKLIPDITLLFADIVGQKEIVIKCELPPKVPVFADQSMINTVLRNLISNAIKFTNPGGKILVTVIQEKNKLTVSIKDNGIGIPNDSIYKLFRIDENYSTRGTANETGTGLGLILCKEFIEKHGGEIWVESEVGKGSVFCFTLPYNT